jgi:hypothetical protein
MKDDGAADDYAAKSAGKKSKADFTAAMKNQTWLDAKECMDWGLSDAIAGDDDEDDQDDDDSPDNHAGRNRADDTSILSENLPDRAKRAFARARAKMNKTSKRQAS